MTRLGRAAAVALAAIGGAAPAASPGEADLWRLLEAGGHVIVLRHAATPRPAPLRASQDAP